MKAILVPGEAGHISQSSICIATSCKTMSIYPYTACMYCCSDPNNPAKQVKPNLVSTVEAWIPEKQFHEFATLACPACLARVLWGQFNKFSGNNGVGHSVSKQTLALKPRRVPHAVTFTNEFITQGFFLTLPVKLGNKKLTSALSWSH